MNRKVELEWNYTPKDILESDHELDFNGTKIQFSKGKVVIITNQHTLQENPFFVTNAENTVKNYLNGYSIQRHTPYKLSRKNTKYFNQDGSVSKSITVKTITHKLTLSSNVEFRITDKDGILIRDSKQEKIQKEKSLAFLISSVEGENQRLIDSYLNAINDKENELVHLYEIRDFVSEKLGGKYKAIKKLPISLDDWDLLGEIANYRPILEGRHRGKHEGNLRNVTAEELELSRDIAKKILFGYLKFHESTS